MFDRSFLPEARLEFVVVTDTHYMAVSATRSVEFESRRRQTERAEVALRQIASLDAAFVVHLGDLVQAFPESAEFDRAVTEALDQLRQCRVRPRQVAGNHDVGDKPDPTMPTDWVTPAALAAYHARFGPSWYSWDAAKSHFVAVNSQIMNAALPEADEQRRWLEADLAAHAGQPIFVFLHLAPFLVDPCEPGLGHYDNIDEPARGWLLNLARQHNIEMVFAGHSHFAFFNRIGVTRSFVVPSTSFTRPGFSEVFSSSPPPERGRDDTNKLGFFVVRLQDDGARVHFVRTAGDAPSLDESTGEQHVLSRLPRDLPRSPLGVTLRHPLAPAAEVPIAWPSSVRQPVRNDYPLLACLELGVRHARVPASDLTDQAQKQRLDVLHDEGVQITATWIWSDRLDLPADIARHRDLLNGFEIQLPGAVAPDEACLRAILRCTTESNLPVTLSLLMSREQIHGKQHPRTRSGYRVTELAELDRRLAASGARIDRVLCRVDPDGSPWETVCQALDLPVLGQIGAIDWAVEFSQQDEQEQVARAAEAMLAAALHVQMDAGSRLFLEPLMDLDRTMDAPYGLLDRWCNPRPVFRVVRSMNTVLFSRPEPRERVDMPDLDGAKVFGLRGSRTTLCLLLPSRRPETKPSLSSRDIQAFAPGAGETRCINLVKATSRSIGRKEDERIDLGAATLLLIENGPPSPPSVGGARR